MRVPLQSLPDGPAAGVALLEGTLPPSATPLSLTYRTRTGAVLSIDGVTTGAFDREHTCVIVPPSQRERVVRLAVERHALPTHGLPSGPNVAWWWMNLRSHPAPQTHIDAEATDGAELPPFDAGAHPLALWGHSHLDVAWLWTYEQASRRAVRTFVNALSLIEADASFTFMQSQPQLYRFVEAADPALFERVRAHARGGRFDASVAAMWVEPDCNVPSGESLVRQMLHAHRFCVERFGVEPSIAWLPDSFGFARTLPTLLAHARIPFFATTKLQWNDTTRFPYPQFRWRGPDGSEIVSALIASYDGGISPARVAAAAERHEPIVVGYGDGGGGPTMRELRDARGAGTWEHPRAWFERLNARRAELPVHDDELYLEYHRGVYTTHHDMKAANAGLERALADAEERLAWCHAVRAPREMVDRLREQLDDAWTIVLRNQFHDVLPGTSIAAVYDDAREEYARAFAIVERVRAATDAALPRGHRERETALSAPVLDAGAFVFDNGNVQARVLPNGTLVELRVPGRPNAVAQANLIASYDDRPVKWEAWNIDAGYERSRTPAKPQEAAIVDDALEIPFEIDDSRATMRISLGANDPFLRVDFTVAWNERRRLLRMESWFAVDAQSVTYGAPHGVVERSARRDTPELRARYEVPGQRFAFVRDGGRAVAVFALDTYGWSARALADGGLALGHSLLRSTTWPDPHADRGEHRLSWAFAPASGAPIGALERAWEAFAGTSRVPLFETDDESVLVAACKIAEDGDGAIVRLRECDGVARTVRLRCGARMREVVEVDALERSLDERAAMRGEAFEATVPAYGLRAYRVRFS